MEHVNWFEKYLMNNKLSKTFIKHCNTCFLTLKGFINRLQNFWQLDIFWNILHKPWHNNIFKIINFFEIFLKLKKNYSKKYSTKRNPKNRRVWFVLSCLHPNDMEFLHDIKKCLTISFEMIDEGHIEDVDECLGMVFQRNMDIKSINIFQTKHFRRNS